jgi:hypothetical protein
MIDPRQVPGDELQLFEADLLQMNGRVNALLELEQRKNLALRQAYNQLKAEFDAFQESVQKKEGTNKGSK